METPRLVVETRHKPFIDEWLSALRSGKYKKVRGKLYNHKQEGFCCMGVMCEILHERKLALPHEEWGGCTFPYLLIPTTGSDPIYSFVPVELLSSSKYVSILADLNDYSKSHGESVATILVHSLAKNGYLPDWDTSSESIGFDVIANFIERTVIFMDDEFSEEGP